MQYTWSLASINDATEIMELCLKIQNEVDTIFNFNPNVLAHNIVRGLVEQHYTNGSEILPIARDADNKIVAFTWAKSGERNMFSLDTMINIKMSHVDPSLSARNRIRLLKDQLSIWDNYAGLTNTPLICSSSLREDQTAFFKLHQQYGYEVRGSTAFKRVDLTSKPTSLF